MLHFVVARGFADPCESLYSDSKKSTHTHTHPRPHSKQEEEDEREREREREIDWLIKFIRPWWNRVGKRTIQETDTDNTITK